MKLIVISSSKNKSDDAKIMTEMFECGLNHYHIRKPSMSTQDMREMIEAVPDHFHSRIVIHSHHKLAGKFGLGGIHLTNVHRRRRFSTWFRLRLLQMKNDLLTVSTTFHKLGHVYNNKSAFDYVFLGTIFDRVSNNFHAGYNEHSVRAVTAKSSIPLIARGGTNADQIEHCRELGFAGVAFGGAVWDSPSPVKAWSDILDRCRAQSISIE